MNLKRQRVVVCGAGGFIGGHLVQSLQANGADVIRAVDIKPLDEWYQTSRDVENLSLDLKDKRSCQKAAKGATAIFQLAADMGGMGFIENNKALCMLSVLTNTHMLMAARDQGVERFFYSSSACVYNAEKQTNPDVVALREVRRLPRDARGRLRLGEALLRAHVPPLRRGLRSRSAASPVITTSTVRSAPGPADAKRLLPPSAARSSKP